MGRPKGSKNKSGSASPERIAELKSLIKSKDYINTAIQSIAINVTKHDYNIDIPRTSCSGVKCSECIDKSECIIINGGNYGRI